MALVGFAATFAAPAPGFAATPAGLSVSQPAASVTFEQHLEAAILAAGPEFEGVRAFYAARAYQPIWTGADRRTAQALLASMGQMFDHGLPSQSRKTTLMAAILETVGEGEAAASAELMFTETYLEFARKKTTGLLIPNTLDEEIYVFPEEKTDDELLFTLASSRDPAEFIQALAPQTEQYRRLQNLLVAMRDTVRGGGWGAVTIPPGDLIRPGDADPRIPAIRDRLTAMGDHARPLSGLVLASTGDNGAQLYDIELEAALRRFQARHGLNDDGVIGNATLAALNVTAEQRMRQVLVNLERERWMNKDLGGKHIYVNLADFRMFVREGGEELFTSRVVIGQSEEHRTPEFSDRMTFMVANPTWTVPRSIAVEEILPELKRNPAYLVENNMRLLPGGSAEVPEDSTLVDWSQYNENNFPWWIRQSPGPHNALGRVKFMFPNKFAIYLHDTPSRSLFRRDVRDYSHGCVRVDRPLDLAHFLLKDQEDDPEAYFQSVLDTAEETEISLKRSLPVHLSYRTVWVDADGQLNFRQDVYGRDATVYSALEQAGVTLFDVKG
ncbi:murein L,D-transpeptidase YcbB/YkuD [Rubricella aquisinus]|uniref:Murein L,D-transpeptidase YcbB/YkuD n=1 Tax=Rubricella aquisinus TaxID=2028108 RepID=A0A840X0N2_9RHOB|nr:murein L,D-transpeptidase YcbB/YkuD [Rubricella aquisinus]